MTAPLAAEGWGRRQAASGEEAYLSLSLSIYSVYITYYVYICIYIYTYDMIYVYVCVYICIYIYLVRHGNRQEVFFVWFPSSTSSNLVLWFPSLVCLWFPSWQGTFLYGFRRWFLMVSAVAAKHFLWLTFLPQQARAEARSGSGATDSPQIHDRAGDA